MNLDIDIIKKEIIDQLNHYHDFLENRFTFMPGFEKIQETIKTNEKLITYYKNSDPDLILSNYIKEITTICATFIQNSKEKKQNVLIILEYMRYMCMYENINFGKSLQTDYLAMFSQSSISLVGLGKGVCAAQSSFLRDLLNQIQILAIELKVDFLDTEMPQFIVASHQVVDVSINGKSFYVDPTWYNGIKTNSNHSNNQAHYNGEKIDSFEATDQEIEQARNYVSKRLIKLLQIDQISNQIISPKMNDLERHCAIFTYVESIMDQISLPVKGHSAQINNKTVEVGKLIELFFIANNIPHQINCQYDKMNTYFTLQLENQEVFLYPYIMFDSHLKSLTKGLHYIPDENNKFIFLHKTSDQMLQRYIKAISAGKKTAQAIKKESSQTPKKR